MKKFVYYEQMPSLQKITFAQSTSFTKTLVHIINVYLDYGWIPVSQPANNVISIFKKDHINSLVEIPKSTKNIRIVYRVMASEIGSD